MQRLLVAYFSILTRSNLFDVVKTGEPEDPEPPRKKTKLPVDVVEPPQISKADALESERDADATKRRKEEKKRRRKLAAAAEEDGAEPAADHGKEVSEKKRKNRDSTVDEITGPAVSP